MPVPERPWRVLLVSPRPGAATRAFDLAIWQAWLALGATIAGVLLVTGAVAAMFGAIDPSAANATAAEMDALRTQLLATRDSLTLAREIRVDGDDPSSDLEPASGATSSESAVPLTSAPPAKPGFLGRPVASKRPVTRTATASADAPVASSGAALPVDGLIASRFSRSRWHPLLHVVRPHLGVDVSAPSGTPIRAPAAGVVTFVGRKLAFGLVVEIQHSAGISTRYAHLRRALVTAGTHVEVGTTIAQVGSSGMSTGPHLHYEVLVGGHQVDPLHFKMPAMGAGTAAPAAGVREGVATPSP